MIPLKGSEYGMPCAVDGFQFALPGQGDSRYPYLPACPIA
jgi:hypothetical protein